MTRPAEELARELEERADMFANGGPNSTHVLLREAAAALSAARAEAMEAVAKRIELMYRDYTWSKQVAECVRVLKEQS